MKGFEGSRGQGFEGKKPIGRTQEERTVGISGRLGMTSTMLNDTIENLLRAPAELKNKLPRDLKVIERAGIEKTLSLCPDFFHRLLGQLRKADAARVFNDVPGVADELAELLWAGIGHQARRTKDLRSLLAKAEREMHVNIEASDSPFQTHFIVTGGTIQGGAGLLHFKDEDFRFMGPTQTLIGLFLGDLPLGFHNLELQTSGHSGWMSRIGPIMREISKVLRGRPQAPQRKEKRRAA